MIQRESVYLFITRKRLRTSQQLKFGTVEPLPDQVFISNYSEQVQTIGNQFLMQKQND